MIAANLTTNVFENKMNTSNDTKNTRPRENDTVQGLSEQTSPKKPKQEQEALRELELTREFAAEYFSVDARGIPYLPRPKAVALDLDETAGKWGPGSLAYRVCCHFGENIAAFRKPFIEHYMEKGGARPYLKELLQTLRDWKMEGRINMVAIFTSASNEKGWVSFLVGCMEEYAATPGLFDVVLAREQSYSDDGVRTVKDLSKLCPDHEQVVLLDDKPGYARNGYVIGVPEYTYDPDMDALVDHMKRAIPHEADNIQTAFDNDARANPPCKVDQSADRALEGCVTVLAEIFPPTQFSAQKATPGCVSD